MINHKQGDANCAGDSSSFDMARIYATDVSAHPSLSDINQLPFPFPVDTSDQPRPSTSGSAVAPEPCNSRRRSSSPAAWPLRPPWFMRPAKPRDLRDLRSPITFKVPVTAHATPSRFSYIQSPQPSKSCDLQGPWPLTPTIRSRSQWPSRSRDLQSPHDLRDPATFKVPWPSRPLRPPTTSMDSDDDFDDSAKTALNYSSQGGGDSGSDEQTAPSGGESRGKQPAAKSKVQGVNMAAKNRQRQSSVVTSESAGDDVETMSSLWQPDIC